MVPIAIVPLRIVGTEDLILRALPLLASADAAALIERYRRDLIRFWLRAKTRVLRFDSLDPLRIRSFLRIQLVRLGVRLVRLRRSCSTGLLTLARGRKSTRLNSSHLGTSYAVFSLK